MRYIDETGKTVKKEQLDLSKGYLADIQVIKEDAAPIDNITKFFYTIEDYENAQQLFLHRILDIAPTDMDRLEARLTYVEMMTGLLEV
jgi:hypothetical protein